MRSEGQGQTGGVVRSRNVSPNSRSPREQVQLQGELAESAAGQTIDYPRPRERVGKAAIKYLACCCARP